MSGTREHVGCADDEHSPTGLYLAWSLPTPLTAWHSISTSCCGRSLARTMFGLVGAGGQCAKTSACSPCGTHTRWEESSSWLSYSADGSGRALGSDGGGWEGAAPRGLRVQARESLKTRVSRSVPSSFIPEKENLSEVPAGGATRVLGTLLSFMSIVDGLTFRGMRPSRWARTSSWTMLVLLWT
jgi:hypothetical protein